MFIELPDLVSPVPAVICPASENCENVMPSVPTATDSGSLVQTQPVSAPAVPPDINTKLLATSDGASKSVALAQAPAAVT